jgi:hypothetical protein
MMQPERIDCTRAEFAKYTGVWPSPDVMGVCILSADGSYVEVEYVFTDDPYPPEKFLTRRDLKDIAELERLYHLN